MQVEEENVETEPEVLEQPKEAPKKAPVKSKEAEINIPEANVFVEHGD